MEPLDYGMDFAGYIPVYPDIQLPVDLYSRQIQAKDALAEKTLQDIEETYAKNIVPEGAFSKDLAQAYNKDVAKVKEIADAFYNKGLSAKDAAMQLRNFRSNVLGNPEMISAHQVLSQHGSQDTWNLYEASKKKAYEAGDRGWVYGVAGGQPIQAQTIDQLRAMHPSTGGYIPEEFDQEELLKHGLSFLAPQESKEPIAAGIRYVTDEEGNQIPQIVDGTRAREYFTEELLRERMAGESLSQFARTWGAKHPGYFKRRLEGFTPAQQEKIILEDLVAAMRGRFYDKEQETLSYKNIPGKKGNKGGGTDTEFEGTPHTLANLSFTYQPITKLKPKDITPKNVQAFFLGSENMRQNAVNSAIAMANKLFPNQVVIEQDEEGNPIRVNLRSDLNVSSVTRLNMERQLSGINNSLLEKVGEIEALQNRYFEAMRAAGLDASRSPEEQILEEYNNIPASSLKELDGALKEAATSSNKYNMFSAPTFNKELYENLRNSSVSSVLSILKEKDEDKYRDFLDDLLMTDPRFQTFAENIKEELEATDKLQTASLGIQDPKLRKDLTSSIHTVITGKQAETIYNLDTGKYLTEEEMDALNLETIKKVVSEGEESFAWRNDPDATARVTVNPNTGDVLPVIQLQGENNKIFRLGFPTITNVDDIVIKDGGASNPQFEALRSFYQEGSKTNFSSSRVGNTYVDIVNQGAQSGYRFYVPELEQVVVSGEGKKDLDVIQVIEGIEELRALGGTPESINRLLTNNGFTGVETDPQSKAFIKTMSKINAKRWGAEDRQAVLKYEREGGPYTERSQDIQMLLGTEGTKPNPNSSAAGTGQFIESTWLAYLPKVAPELDKQAKTKEEKLALRNNPEIARKATVAYANDLKDRIISSRAATTVEPWMLKLAYMFDSSGINVIKAFREGKEDARIRDYISSEAIKANPEVFQGKVYLKDLVKWSQDLMGF